VRLFHFGLQRSGRIVLGAGLGVIAHQHLIGGQFALDGAGAVSLKHTRLVGDETTLDLLIAEIGDAHAGGRQRQNHRIAEKGLGAKRHCRENAAARIGAGHDIGLS